MLVGKLAAALAARLATTDVTVFSGVFPDEAAACPSVFRLASLETWRAARLGASTRVWDREATVKGHKGGPTCSPELMPPTPKTPGRRSRATQRTGRPSRPSTPSRTPASRGIVGHDLRLVERVTGRLTNARAAGAGAASGAWFGLFIGLLVGLFTTGPEWLGLVLGGLLIGAFWGAVFGFFAHWATRGQRDFSSVSNFVAGSYELTVPNDQAQRARELLGELR